jgi:hypothetical protein
MNRATSDAVKVVRLLPLGPRKFDGQESSGNNISKLMLKFKVPESRGIDGIDGS